MFQAPTRHLFDQIVARFEAAIAGFVEKTRASLMRIVDERIRHTALFAMPVFTAGSFSNSRAESTNAVHHSIEISTTMALVEAFTAISSRANEYVCKAGVSTMPRVLRRLFIEPGLKNTITNYSILEWLVQRDRLGRGSYVTEDPTVALR
jgi:hypothetical protein